jgi:predicted nucleotidyltransferase
MDTEKIRKLTPYQDINSLLADWTEKAKNILGENVVGLYLSGSLSYGDFVPERSDIDLQAVIRRPLNEPELKSIEQLHRGLDERYPAWKGRLECSYVPLELMQEVLPPKTPRPWWGFDTLYAEAGAGNEWIINHYFLSKHSVALDGPDFTTLIPPIDMREVRKASARDLFKEWEPKINDSEWLANPHYQSYLVLNLCRILHTVIGNGPASKKVAAEWTKAAYPQWENLIEEAEQWEYGKEMKRHDEAVAFIRFAIEKVNKTGILGSRAHDAKSSSGSGVDIL